MSKNYIIVDFQDRNFISMVQNDMMLGDFPIEVETARTLNELTNALGKLQDATIVVRNNVLESDNFSIDSFAGYEIIGFCRNLDEAEAIRKNNLSCLSITRTSGDLLGLLSKEPLSYYCQSDKNKNAKRVDPKEVIQNMKKEEQKQVQEPKVEPEQPVSTPQQTAPVMPGMPGMTMTPEQMAMVAQFMQMMQNGGFQPSQPAPEQTNTFVQEEKPEPKVEEEPVVEQKEEKKKKQKQKDKKKNLKEKLEKKDPVDEALIDRGIYIERKKNQKATVATVYAAKGGVGKTTVATETAVYLSLMSYAGSNLSVCIVDYNIDFGDVCTHCELDPQFNSMVIWADEIEHQIENGANPDNINFSEEDIKENYLQKMEKTGLYALIAPTAHEDSMNISSAALKVMLRNLVENCGFDFVICDTGNNTRDAAIIALEMSDEVIMIATQDVTTANCDASVLRVLNKIGMNTDKIKLVVNNIIPANEAGISVKEVIDAFGMDCIAKIKRTPDIIKANNFGKPLVYKPKHEFTKQIGNIANYLTSGIIPDQDEPEEKRSFFSFLKR